MPGDASGSSAAIDSKGIRYQSGTWSGDWRKESSNFREADNLVLWLEGMAKVDKVARQEICMFPDSMLFEACYYKGHSESKKLSDIIFCLHKAEREGRFKLYAIHVAGTRMKSFGIDGISRGT